jgi:Leucine-rich repeat (LRR) protein
MQDSSHIKRAVRWLWRPRISLRGLLVLVALISVAFFGVASVRRAYEQDRAAQEILGSELGFAFDTSSILPDWVFDYVGPDRLTWFERAGEARLVVITADDGTYHAGPWLGETKERARQDFGKLFPRLGECRYLTELTLDGGPIDDRLLGALSELHNLKSLELGNLPINGQSLATLNSLRQLRELYIYDCPIEPTSLNHIAHFPTLEKLHVSEIAVGSALCELDGSRLRELELPSCQIDDSIATLLDHCPQLESLDLSYNNVTDRVIAPLASARKLDYLGLSYTGVTCANIDRLRDCPLRGLTLTGSETNDVGAASVGQLHSLQYIDVAVTKVTAVGLARIAALPKLERLDASYLELDPAVVAGIEFSSSIRVLRLQKTGVDDQCIDRFLKMASLKELDLRDCPISDDGKAPLKAAIKRVDLGKSPN